MTLDLSSLFHTTIGFDDIARILNNFANSEQANTYPPYNISKIDDCTYRISIALAGFETNDIDKQDKQTVIIYRNYSTRAVDKKLILEIRNYCKKKGLKFYISNHIKLAMKLNLDGAYIPSFNKNRISRW